MKNAVVFLAGNIYEGGGIESITLSVAKRLSSDCDIYIASANCYKRSDTSPLDEGSGIRFFELSGKSKLSRLLSLFRLISKTKATHVIIQGKNLYHYCYLSRWMPHTCFCFYDHDSFRAYPDSQANEYLPRERAARHADKIIVLTNDNREEYEKRLNVPTSKLLVLPNFVEPPACAPAYNCASKTIIAVGRLHRQKRFDLLIEAFARVSKSIPDWELVIYGEGPERGSLELLVARLGLQRTVSLPGWASQPYQVYPTASFLVLSSEHEGFGLVLLEALEHNLPVVSFDCPSGPGDIIQNDVNGILVPNGDTFGLGEAILRLATNDELRRRFSDNAKFSTGLFKADQILNKWHQLLQIN